MHKSFRFKSCVIFAFLFSVSFAWGSEDLAPLPSQLFAHWVHAHEQDADGVEVYVIKGTELPRARGRIEFEIRADGSFDFYDIAPADGTLKIAGRWTQRPDAVLSVSFPGSDRDPLLFKIISCEERLLKLRPLD